MDKKLAEKIDKHWNFNIVPSHRAAFCRSLFLLPDGRWVKCDDIHFCFAKAVGGIQKLFRNGVARVQICEYRPGTDQLAMEAKTCLTYDQRVSVEAVLMSTDISYLLIENPLTGARVAHSGFRVLRHVPEKFNEFFEDFS